MPLADGAVNRRSQNRVLELLAGQIELGAPLGEHPLAVADFLDGVLVLSLRHFESRFGRVQVAARREPLVEERLHPVPVETRLLQHGAPLTQQARALEINRVLVSRSGQAEPDARLVERGFGLVQAELEVVGQQTRDDLAFADRGSQVDVERIDPAGDLERERNLVFSRQRPGDGDHAVERLFCGQHTGHLPRRIGVGGAGGNRLTRVRARRQEH